MTLMSMDGGSFRVRFDEDDTGELIRMKMVIARRACEDCKLYFGGRLLKDDWALKHQGLEANSTIYIVKGPCYHIRLDSGKILTLEFNGNETWGHHNSTMRKKIRLLGEEDCYDEHLVYFAGKELHPKCPFHDFGVKDGCTIFLVKGKPFHIYTRLQQRNPGPTVTWPGDIVTWGEMLKQLRRHFNAWQGYLCDPRGGSFRLESDRTRINWGIVDFYMK